MADLLEAVSSLSERQGVSSPACLLHCLALLLPLSASAEWMEAQGEDPAQITYAELMERASEGGNWQRALNLFDGAPGS